MTVAGEHGSLTRRPACGSIVIPAHNEQGTIGFALNALLREALEGEFAVVVACNGCTDATADEARKTSAGLPGPIVVLELAEASKPAAIRAAERECAPPRLYLDADVICSTAAAREMLAAVQSVADVAVPTRSFDLSGSTRFARLYYRTWLELPWVTNQLAGRGAYALSQLARSTFGEFPELVADDRFATTRVPADRAVVTSERVVVRPPARLRDVARVRGRVYAGNAALEVDGHDLSIGRRWRGLMRLSMRPSRWPGLVVFLATTAVAKSRARNAHRAEGIAWTRDVHRRGMSQ